MLEYRLKSMANLQEINERAAQNRRRHGFYTPRKITGYAEEGIQVRDCDLMLGKLMLVVTEIAEAAEACRKGDIEHFWEEIGDAYIRLGDVVATAKRDIEQDILNKMDINEARPFKHGKQSDL